MMMSNVHVSDEELLLAIDGELSNNSAARVQAHLASCWMCRARRSELESTIIEFTRSHYDHIAPELPPISSARAQLRLQIAEIAAHRTTGSWAWLHRVMLGAPKIICLIIAMAGEIGILALRHHLSVNAAEASVLPISSVTPGAVRPITISEACSMAHEEVIKDVPASIKERVFQEYGIVNARPGEYEIDYLIAPSLGGTDDIRNLWPEPYDAHRWNAHVKDALEEYLHQLVCARKVDIETAQHAIASDWITAYKKHFHTQVPIYLHSDAELIPSKTKGVI